MFQQRLENNIKMDDITPFLRKLFTNTQLVDELEHESKLMELQDNVKILSIGDYVKIVPLVIEGRVKVMRNDESGKEILLYYINPGESCALSIAAGLNNQKSAAYAVTNNNTKLLAIPVDKLETMIKVYPYLNKFVLKLFHQRFNELIEFIDAISFKNVDMRLLNYIKKNLTPANGNFIYVTHKQIAEELGTAREVVSRLLKQLEKEGKVKNHRGKIEIISAL